MKKSLSIAILFAMLLLPILGVGQSDITTYWYSVKQDEARKEMQNRGVAWGDGSRYTYKQSFAPNGSQFTCQCNGVPQIKDCCGNWDDLTMVCITVDNVVADVDRGMAQKNTTVIARSSNKKIATLEHRGDFTWNAGSSLVIDADSVITGSITKDTTTVEVLCKYKKIDTNKATESHWLQVDLRRQERTFEKRSLPPPNKRDPFLGHAIVWEWVVTETRWLEDTSGCYQLTPLED